MLHLAIKGKIQTVHQAVNEDGDVLMCRLRQLCVQRRGLWAVMAHFVLDGPQVQQLA